MFIFEQIDLSTILIALLGIFAINAVLVVGSLINKKRHRRQMSTRTTVAELATNYFTGGEFPKDAPARKFLDAYIGLRETIDLDEETLRRVNDTVIAQRFDLALARIVRSPFKRMRKIGATQLGYLNTETAISALQVQFERERDLLVKSYMVNGMRVQGNDQAIPAMVESLVGAPSWYIKRVEPVIFGFGKVFHDYASTLFVREEYEIKALLLRFGEVFVAGDLKEFMLEQTRSANRQLRILAANALSQNYPEVLSRDEFVQSSDVDVLKIVIRALSTSAADGTIGTLLNYAGVEDLTEHVIYALSTMARREPGLLNQLLKRFRLAVDKQERTIIARVLSNRIEYFIFKLLGRDKEAARDLLGEVLAMGLFSDTIGFLNKNRDQEIEREVVEVIRRIIPGHEDMERELGLYVRDSVLQALGLERVEITKDSRTWKRDTSKVRFLTTILVGLLLAFPIVFVVTRFGSLSTASAGDLLRLYVLDFAAILAIYSIAINLVYAVILFLSAVGSARQARMWKIKRPSMLFQKSLLPSISIIAPAYSEEATIIESANSLLNLKYPDYELIIVNDGSPDDTLNTLIEYFDLEKYDVLYDRFLETKPIRGIYVNKNRPGLVVVDKENGGKADSLNAGINLSRKEYVCGIDADSLLEPEALLRAASLMLDTDRESVAVGGNIFPINGCTVERGSITTVATPRNFLALSQTIEYLRSFMAGRVGWATINSLLIISGAFGIFSRIRLHEVGGYLTESGRYHRDTVGEDMELVVRLTRHMREHKVKHSIHYAFNANCWTEVPESLKILHSQRDRWHRGLLDILSFHRSLLFNPRYGMVGLVALPYYVVFEMAGPIIELQGYLMVVLAGILGMINPVIAALLFVSVIMTGILISVSSLYIAEKDANIFSVKEFFVLLGFAVVENLGFRQLVSFWRVTGFLSALKKPKGWGKMVRKGFASK